MNHKQKINKAYLRLKIFTFNVKPKRRKQMKMRKTSRIHLKRTQKTKNPTVTLKEKHMRSWAPDHDTGALLP